MNDFLPADIAAEIARLTEREIASMTRQKVNGDANQRREEVYAEVTK